MKQWFFEKTLPNCPSDFKIGFKVKKTPFSERSKYQKIEVFDTYLLGKILVLDGIVQLSEKYEFIYHETIVHLPLFYHPNPEKVLVIGGGDGGALREILRHPVKGVSLVEIDEKVLDVSKRCLPFLKLKNSLKDKRTRLVVGNGTDFIKKFKNYFDIIICDSTDPLGPSEALFSKTFYRNVFETLSGNGIFITQSGNFITQLPEIKNAYYNLKAVFPFVKIHRAVIFDYQLTDFSFVLASEKINLEKVSLKQIEKRFKKFKNYRKLNYYSPEIHFSSGILPKFYQDKLK